MLAMSVQYTTRESAHSATGAQPEHACLRMLRPREPIGHGTPISEEFQARMPCGFGIECLVSGDEYLPMNRIRLHACRQRAEVFKLLHLERRR